MKKLFTKIVGISLGIAMAIGVGFGLGAKFNSDALHPIYAAETDNGDGTFSDTISGGTVVGTGASATITWTIGGGNIEIVSHSGGGNQVANTNRLYRYNYVEITASNGYSIVNLEINYSTTYRGANNAGGTAISENRISAGQSNVTVSDSGESGGTITVTPNSTANTHFFFQNAATGDTNTQLRWSEFKINYNKSGGVIPDPTYTVTYQSNGATSGSVPTDATVYSNGASVTVLGNTGSLTKTGYIWAGWNEKADGTGTSYAAGSSFAISKATTLYARWISDYSDSTSLDITALYLNLPTSSATGYTQETLVHADDGMEYVVAPSSGNKVYGYTASSDNSFDNSSNSKILIGKADAYIYNKDPFQKNIAAIKVYASANCSTNVKVAVDLGTTARVDPYSTVQTQLSTTDTVYTLKSGQGNNNYRYFRLQVTNAYNAQIQIRILFNNPTTNVSVSPSSATLAPNETQQLTTTITPADSTDLLTYVSSDDDVATVDADGLITAHAVGTATITATSGGFSDTCDVTVEEPAVHFATPTKNSTSGYTGQNDVIEFSYGNLDDSLSVSSNNANVSASIQNDNGADGAEVKIVFVSAGSSEVYIKDGSSTLATITVTITASSVTIEGLPSEKTVYIGRTKDLGSSISVTAIGSYSSDVTWESDDDSIATVDGSGVITGVAAGNVDITVTSDDYPSATMTCSVTVYEVPDDAYVIDFGTTKNTNPAAIDDDEGFKTEYSFSDSSDVTVSGLVKAYGVSSSMLKLGSNKATASITFTIPSTRYISYVSIEIDTAGGSSLNVTSGAVGAETENQTIAAGILTFDDHLANEKSNSVTLTSTANGAFYVTNIIVGYVSIAKETIESIDTLSALRFNYSGASEISGAAIRFGGFISDDLWNALNSESTIQGYGVLLAETDWLQDHTTTIKDEYAVAIDMAGTVDGALELLCGEHNGDEEIRRYMANGASPATANSEQKAFMGVAAGDTYYTWQVRINFGSKFTTSYSAVAFIKTADGLVFFDEISVSAKELATAVLPSIDSELPVHEPIQYISERP